MINVANVVTISRVVLALATVPLFWQKNDQLLWMAFGITALVISADALDGYLARKFNLTSKLGAVLDIAGDRCVEMTYWIVFATLNWIPVWVPLLFLARGTFVDAVRSALSEKGYTAFGAQTMMQSALGRFLVASNFSRFFYAVAKAIAFCLLIAAHTAFGLKYNIAPVALAFVYFSAAFCLIRGLPVLIEATSLL